MNVIQPIAPITPRQAFNPMLHEIQPGIVDVVNELLRQKFDGRQALILQEDIVALFNERYPDYERERIFREKQLNIEQLYRDSGWIVEYEKPLYYETFPARFIFKAKPDS